MKYTLPTGIVLEGTPAEIKAFVADQAPTPAAATPNAAQSLPAIAHTTWTSIKDWKDPFTTAHVAWLFDISQSAASNRMSSLIRAGLIRRLHKGTYEVVR